MGSSKEDLRCRTVSKDVWGCRRLKIQGWCSTVVLVFGRTDSASDADRDAPIRAQTNWPISKTHEAVRKRKLYRTVRSNDEISAAHGKIVNLPHRYFDTNTTHVHNVKIRQFSLVYWMSFEYITRETQNIAGRILRQMRIEMHQSERRVIDQSPRRARTPAAVRKT